MTIDTGSANLWSEIRAAELFRDSHLERVDEMIENYVGSAYRSDLQGDWSENHMFEYTRLTTSKVVWDNPRVRVKTRRPGTQRIVAKAMQHAENRWVKDVQLRQRLELLYNHMNFCYAVAQTVVEPQPWMDPREASMPQWPMVYVMDFDRFFFDPMCRWYGQARFAGHKWVRDKDDLIQEAEDFPNLGWNLDALKELAENAGIEELRERGERHSGTVDRSEVVAYDVWIPEVHLRDPDDGFHGSIYTMAVGGGNSDEEGDDNPLMIREPRPYYGPRWGPYTLYGVYPVPGDPFPLSSFIATYQQQRDANDISRSVVTAIQRYKKLIVVSADNPDLVKKVKDTPDAFVIPVKGFEKDQVIELELGGITPQHLEQMTQSLDRLDRNTGMSEVQRGNVGTRSTATEIAVAESAGSESIAFVKQKFTDATQQVLSTAAWFLYHDDRINFPLGEEAAEDFGMIEPWFTGGSYHSDSGARYDDLELDIEPYSMERMNEALARAQYSDLVQMVVDVAPMIPEIPWIDWKKLFEKGGQVHNDPAMSEVLLPDQISETESGIRDAATTGGNGAMAATRPRRGSSRSNGNGKRGRGTDRRTGYTTGAQHTATQKQKR